MSDDDDRDLSSGPSKQCPWCHQAIPADARICPNCGSGTANVSPGMATGLTVLRVLLAIVIGIVVLPLGAFGACFAISGSAMLFSGGGVNGGLIWPIAGVLMVAAAAGGVALIIRLFRSSNSGGEK